MEIKSLAKKTDRRKGKMDVIKPKAIQIRKELMGNVLKIIAEYYRVPMSVFDNGSRYPHNIKIKQVARCLCYQFLNKAGRYFQSILADNKTFKSVGVKDIASMTGGETHFVVAQALKRVSDLYDTDKEYRAEIDELTNIILKSADFGGRFVISNLRELGMELTISKDKLNNVYCRIDTEVSSATLTHDEMEVLYYMWQNHKTKLKKIIN